MKYFTVCGLALAFSAFVAVASAAAGPLDGNTSASAIGISPEISFGSDSKVMSDLLTLQKQVAVLERLVEREKQLVSIAKSYHQMNLPFAAPPPTVQACQILPPTLTCAEGYPKRYPKMQAMLRPQMQKISNLPMQNTNQAMVVDQSVPQIEAMPEYVWLDLRCNGPECLAIVKEIPVISSGDSASGLSHPMVVRVGEILPEFGDVVAISADGVRVKTDKGEIVSLAPAPQ